MINALYSGLVKIGKTTKDPQERAKELSSATGVATPFIVVYKKGFKNCHTAEKLVHSILEEQGYRVNSSREFFNIDITDAINLIMSIPDENHDDCVEDNSSEDNLAEIFYNKAIGYYLGTDDVFQDEDLALEYFEKSASLGKAEAYIKIGDIWNERGNSRQAYNSYKKGVDNGCYICYGKLGEIYNDKDSGFYSKRNAELAYKKFFEYIDKSDVVQSNLDFAWKHMGIGNIVDLFISVGIINDDISLEQENFLVMYIPQIKTHFEETLEQLYEFNPNTARYYESMNRPYINKLVVKHKTYGFEEIKLAKEYFLLAKESFKSVEDFDNSSNYLEAEQNAFNLFTKSAELGYNISNVYIGIHWLYKGYDLSIYNADKAWRFFYNNAYYTFTKQSEIISIEQREECLYGFTLLISYAIKFHAEKLIHEYYIQLALHLGIIDYYSRRIEELSSIQSSNSDYYESELERKRIENVHSFIKKYVQEFMPKDGTESQFKIYPLDTEF